MSTTVQKSLEFLSKSRTSNMLKKPIKAQPMNSNSMHLANAGQFVMSGNPRSNNHSTIRMDERTPMTVEYKTETRNGFHRKTLSLTPDKNQVKGMSGARPNNYENLVVTSGMKAKESPQFRPKNLNSEVKQVSGSHAPSKSMGGLNAFQQQLGFRENLQNSNRKEARLTKNNSLVNMLDDRTDLQNGALRKVSSDVKLPRIEMSTGNYDLNGNGPFDDRAESKNSRGKPGSMDRGNPGMNSSNGGAGISSMIQNLRAGPRPTVQQQYINPVNVGGFGGGPIGGPSFVNGSGVYGYGSMNSGFPHGNNPSNQGLAKRGTLVDDENIKTISTLQNMSSRNPSVGRSNSKDRGLEKSNSLPPDADGKIVTGIAFKTKAGALPGKPVKTNQDAYIIHQNFAGNKNNFFFAVCDGHGVNGHHASGLVKQNLPRNIEAYYKNVKSDDDVGLKEALTKGFLQTNKELNDSNIDVNFSGSTTVSVLMLNDRIISANVGDSRAIMGKFSNNQWSALPLSVDHKPDDPREMQRIISRGGRIESFKDYNGDPIGPARVWLKNENVPGLAMARSLGDAVAASVGVIAEPEIMDWYLQEEDKFMIIASDGVWEFLSNEQIINYAVPFYLKGQLDAACEKIVRESTICWKQEDEVVDDITCIIVTLKVPPKELK